MRSFLDYIWLVIQTAWRQSADLTQYILFFAIIAGGGLTWARPDIAPMIPDLSGWQVTAIVLGVIVLIRLLLAPYWIYQEQRAAIENLSVTTDDLVRIVITKTNFNPAWSQLDLSVALVNPGLPTALFNWRAKYIHGAQAHEITALLFDAGRSFPTTAHPTIDSSDRSLFNKFGEYIGPMLQVSSAETLANVPLEAGGSRTGRVCFTVPKGVDLSNKSGAKITLMADDVNGRTATASYIF